MPRGYNQQRPDFVPPFVCYDLTSGERHTSHAWVVPSTMDAKGHFIEYGDQRRDYTCRRCLAQKPDQAKPPGYTVTTWRPKAANRKESSVLV